MRNEIKRVQRKRIGHGGFYCACCGPAPKHRPALRRYARRKLKQELNHPRYED